MKSTSQSLSTGSESKVLASIQDHDNLLKAELDVLMEEYRLCTTRMIREVDSDEKGFEFNLVGIGALIVAITFAVDKKAYFLLLLLALPFHILTWSLARRNLWTSFLVGYMTTVLAPRINKLIQGSNHYQPGNYDQPHFLSWEKYHWSRLDENPHSKIILAMPLAGRAVMQIAVTIVTILAYFLYVQADPAYQKSAFDDILIWLNGAFYLVSVINLGITTIGWLKKPNKAIASEMRTILRKRKKD